MRSCKRKAREARTYREKYGLRRKEEIQLIKKLVANSNFSFGEVVQHFNIFLFIGSARCKKMQNV